jgi:hypothetical protein
LLAKAFPHASQAWARDCMFQSIMKTRRFPAAL